MAKLTHRHFTLNFRHHIQWWWHQEYLTNIAGQGASWGDGAVDGRVTDDDDDEGWWGIVH